MITGLTFPANFNLEKSPELLQPGKANSDCEDIGHLVVHMVTRNSRIVSSNTSMQRKENMMELSNGYMVEVGIGSVGLVDFLDACMIGSNNLETLLNVGVD